MAVGKQFDEENGYENSREIAFYMQQVAKDAGMTEEELAKQILAEEESDDADGFVEETLKDQEALQSLGLWDRFKTAVKKPFTSISDWSDSHDPQWKSAMVQAMFGDVAPMNNYYQQQKQIEEAQKNREFQAEQARLNRESQQEYNSMWKQLEEAKAKKEQYESAEREFAELMQKPERSVADEKRIEQLLEKYPELNKSGINEAVIAANEAAAEKRKAAFAASVAGEKFLSTVPTTFKTDAEKKKWISDNAAAISELPEDIQKQVWQKIGGKSQAQIDAEARHSAGVSYGIQEGQKETSEKKSQNKEQKKLADEGRARIKKGLRPTRKQQAAIDGGF